MKTIKIRSIQEARDLELPLISNETLNAFHVLEQRVAAGGMGKHTVIREIYKIVDEVGSMLSPFTVCSKGCSHCCRIPVLLTDVEATYISRNTANKAAIEHFRPVSQATNGDPCPLLTGNNDCSVYEYRPLACRAFATFDNPSLCESREVEHVTYGVQSNLLFKKCREWIIELNQKGGAADIRSYFGLQPRHHVSTK